MRLAISEESIVRKGGRKERFIYTVTKFDVCLRVMPLYKEPRGAFVNDNDEDVAASAVCIFPYFPINNDDVANE